MEASQMYVLFSIIILLVVAILAVFIRKRNKKQKNVLTPLTGFAFGFIIAGIVFGSNRLVGYSLMGIGVLLAIIDMFIKLRRK